MTLSPRQIDAYLEFNDRLDQRELANQLLISAIGAQGDNKTITKTLKELSS